MSLETKSGGCRNNWDINSIVFTIKTAPVCGLDRQGLFYLPNEEDIFSWFKCDDDA